MAARKAKQKTEETETETEVEESEDLGERVVELRDGGMNWAEIKEEVGGALGKIMLAHARATVTPREKIKWKTEEELAEAVVSARQDGLSWGKIMVRAGISEGKARSVYEESTGESTRGLRVGKGGRYPAGEEPPEPEPKPAKKTKTKTKAVEDLLPKTGKRKPPAPVQNLQDMDLEELSERLTGKKITVGRGSKNVVIGVREVTGLEGGDLEFVDAKTGSARTVPVKDIAKASR